MNVNVSVQFSDVLLYASRSVTSPVQFKVHGKIPVSGVTVSSVLLPAVNVEGSRSDAVIFTGRILCPSVLQHCWQQEGNLALKNLL